MAGDAQEWSSNANDAVRISFVQPSAASSLKTISTFHPKFTYPIFGEEEHIFGYQNLDIHLRFAAHNLRPNLEISYDKKFPAVGGTSALDLNKTLKDWLPKESFQKKGEFEKAVTEDDSTKDYTPPGKLVHSYTRKGKNFEVWAGSLSDPAVSELLNRIQVFVSFFIEGGTPLNTSDVEWTIERWMVYFVYEKLELPAESPASPYSFVGYATTYRFYAFTGKNGNKSSLSIESFPQKDVISMSELPSRLRISQFIILPPHQHQGHGSELYNTIFNIAFNDPTIHELTVEDPNEEFDVIRDLSDYDRLQPEFVTANISINPDPFTNNQRRPPKRLPTGTLLPMTTLTALRHKYKIAPRQFARMTELYLLSKIPSESRAINGANMVKLMTQKWRLQNVADRTYYWWRMLVKQRIYKKNKDALIQLDTEERFSKLEETVMMQEAEYELLLVAIEERRKKLQGIESATSEADVEASSSGRVARKRKLVLDDDDDDEDEEEETNGDSAKRTKT